MPLAFRTEVSLEPSPILQKGREVGDSHRAGQRGTQQEEKKSDTEAVKNVWLLWLLLPAVTYHYPAQCRAQRCPDLPVSNCHSTKGFVLRPEICCKGEQISVHFTESGLHYFCFVSASVSSEFQ